METSLISGLLMVPALLGTIMAFQAYPIATSALAVVAVAFRVFYACSRVSSESTEPPAAGL